MLLLRSGRHPRLQAVDLVFNVDEACLDIDAILALQHSVASLHVPVYIAVNYELRDRGGIGVTQPVYITLAAKELIFIVNNIHSGNVHVEIVHRLDKISWEV